MTDISTDEAAIAEPTDASTVVPCTSCAEPIRLRPEEAEVGLCWRCASCVRLVKATGLLMAGGRIYLDDEAESEASLRSSIARFARLHGWDVQEEVHIPGWGRIDLVLGEPSQRTILVELKLELIKPAKVRAAFQQADGYSRWWASNRGVGATTVLTSLKSDRRLVDQVGDMYLSVLPFSLTQLRAYLAYDGEKGERLRVAEKRRAELRYQLALQEIAVKNLTPTRGTNGEAR